MRLRTILPVLAAAGVAVPAAQAAPAGAARTDRDIVAAAAASGQFKTLVGLVGQAGLRQTLQGKGPYTVLAPTDAAFAKVPKGTLARLAADRAALRSVLTHHVAKGNLTAAKVAKRRTITMLDGRRVAVRVRGGRVYVGGARVVRPDVAASNGVIHVIDRVLIPR